MKTKTFIRTLLLLAVVSFVACTKDDNDNSARLTSDDASINAKMDNISNDISLIAEDQLDQQSTTRMNHPSVLPPCATVTTVVSGNTWTRTIDFGTTGCAFTNGNGAILRGVITISGSTDFTQSPYVWNYSFTNFYYNDIRVEGTRTLSRTVQATSALSTPHPVVGIVLDLQITFPNGNTYHRTGNRTRELIVGFDTPLNFQDNVYSVTGNWTTTGSSTSHTSTITTPLRIEIACQYKLVSGVIEIQRNNHRAVLNYGAGTCDNNGTISIDGGTAYPFTFGN